MEDFVVGDAEKDIFTFTLTEKGWEVIATLMESMSDRSARHKLAFIRATMSQYTLFFGSRPDFVICSISLWDELVQAIKDEFQGFLYITESSPVVSGLLPLLFRLEDFETAIIEGVVYVRDSEITGDNYYLASLSEFQRIYRGKEGRRLIDVATGEMINESEYTMKTFPDFTVRVFEDISKEALHDLMLRIIRKLRANDQGD